MDSARRVYRLYVAVAALGAVTVLGAWAVVLNAITGTFQPAGRLAASCFGAPMSEVTLATGLFAVLAIIGLTAAAAAVRSALRQLRATRRSLHRLRIVDEQHGALVFDDPRLRAFCVGLLRPRVYMSSGAVACLTDEELSAVVAHENHHARRRDPLRKFTATLLSDCLFFLPTLRLVRERHTALLELDADAAAVAAAANDPRPLARALLAFEERGCDQSGAVSPERVDRLLGESEPSALPLSWLASALVAIGVVFVLAARAAEATSHSDLTVDAMIGQLAVVGPVLATAALAIAVVMRAARVPRA